MTHTATNKTCDSFLTLLAHELRNPLATILSSIELIDAIGIDAKETPRLLSIIEERVHALTATLDDLLNNAKHRDATAQNASLLTTDDNMSISLASVADGELTFPLFIETEHNSPDALRVLIVDDNKHAADSLGQLLSLRGYNITVAYSGAQALTLLSHEVPTVAILDIGMPEMDGYQLAEQIKKGPCACTLIALTGFAQAHDKEKALASGFDFHLTKPASIKDIDTLLKKVESALLHTPTPSVN